MKREAVIEFFETEIRNWELARNNFQALECVLKKPFKCGDMQGYVQFNPARSVSSLAKVDKESIKNRKCFLCSDNRPKKQRAIKLLSDWNLLVNPYPILPFHFTIANDGHIPQKLQIQTGTRLAKELEGFVVFFNDDGAGASAPDHMHFQAVSFEHLPLIRLINDNWPEKEKLNLPFKILTDPDLIKKCQFPMNVYFWSTEINETSMKQKEENEKGCYYESDGKEILIEKGEENPEIRILAIPRKAHRPEEFYKGPPLRRAFSPGALDMAGIMVTPIENDFNAITSQEIENIYRQVGFSEL